MASLEEDRDNSPNMIGQIIVFPVLTATELVALKGKVVEISDSLVFAIVTESHEEADIKVGEKIGVSPMQVVKVSKEET